MAKVLFFNLPFYGHTHPTQPLVAEMVRRGEQVLYYSSETFRPAIEQAGATFRGINAFMTEQTFVDENLMRFAHTLIRTTQEVLPTILPEVQADPPDYILYDSLCVWGKCVAQIVRVPAITSVTTLARPHSLLHPEVLASFLEEAPGRAISRCGRESAPMTAGNRACYASQQRDAAGVHEEPLAGEISRTERSHHACHRQD